MTAQEEKVTGEHVSETGKKLVAPMTQQACDACSQSGDFLDVLLTQTVGSHVLNLVAEDERGKYASAAAAKVTVEHVHVHQGGQAIVGNVERSPEPERRGKTDDGAPSATTREPACPNLHNKQT